MAQLPEHLEERIRREVEEQGIFLLELKRRGQTNSTVLEIIVDSENGVTLDMLADLSRNVSSVLDEHEEAIRGRYRLEVSTPGIERPLEHNWQFEKNVGRLLRITYVDNEEKKTSLFRLIDVQGENVTLELSTRSKGKSRKPVKAPDSPPIVLTFNSIERAIVEPEF